MCHPGEVLVEVPDLRGEAICRERLMQEGLQVLVQIAIRFQNEARIFYQLASHQAQLGCLGAAR